MSTTTIRFEHTTDGVDSNVAEVFISTGVIRTDTQAIVVAVNTPLVPRSTGIYVYTFDDPADGLTYSYTLAWKEIGDDELYTQERMQSSPAGPGPEPPFEPSPPEYVADMDIVRAGIPTNRQGCPILTRVNAFVIEEGVAPTLEFVFRDSAGRPINLEPTASVSEFSRSSQSRSRLSESSTSSQSVSTEADEVFLWVREHTGTGAADARFVWEMPGSVYDAAGGVVRVSLDDKLVQQSGLYLAHFGFKRAGKLRLTGKSVLSIEPSLFHDAGGNGLDVHRTGCLTIQEVRLHTWDTSPEDNLLLNDYEYSADQIMEAILRPVEYFNEINPPLSVRYNTTNFPWRNHWIEAAVSQLKTFAADWYMRNRLQGAAGGINIDDLNKENVYRASAQRDWQKYAEFVTLKKVEINMAECVGTYGSSYDTH